MNTTTTVITNVQYGVPSGTYDGSSQDFITIPIKAAGYYRGYGSTQTIMISVTDFIGRIHISASLNDLVNSAIYFPVNTFGDGSSVISGVYPFTEIGNFVWIRFEITQFQQGTINFIRVTY